MRVDADFLLIQTPEIQYHVIDKKDYSIFNRIK